VSISASCNNVGVSSSCIIGSIAALNAMAAGKLLNRYKIDDPIGSFQIFGFSGLWGCLAVGIFDKDLGLINTGSFSMLRV
jgi:Amt family ammonium transporter